MIRAPIASDTLRGLMDRIAPLKKGFDLLGDHVVITDADAHILFANKAAERNTGFVLEEMLGKNPADLWGGNMPKAFYEHMWHAIKAEKKPFTGEVENKRKNGTRYWQEIHISPVLDAQGDAQFFIGIEPNITDRKEKEKFRDEFASLLGHQLKNPLAAVRWLTEFLLKDAALAPEERDKITGIAEANDSMVALVADLLALARIGAPAETAETFGLVEEIRKIVGRVRQANPLVALSFDTEGQNLALHADKSLVLQVFTNLIANAAEYADAQKGDVRIALAKNSEGILFSSASNGSGIPINDQPNIFSKLFRASNAASRKKQGSGLGLFIVKLVCDALGWRVWFQSPRPHEKDGAIFFVHIPVTVGIDP